MAGLGLYGQLYESADGFRAYTMLQIAMAEGRRASLVTHTASLGRSHYQLTELSLQASMLTCGL